MKRNSIYLWLMLVTLANIALANVNFFAPHADDLTYGKEDAPIQVLEYYSLTCPHCSYFYLNSFLNLKRDYIDKGEVRWIKHSYTADLQSLKATMFLSCVPKDRYESYLRILLSKQSNWAYQTDFIPILSNIASLGGMSRADFNKCLNDGKKEESITAFNNSAKDSLQINGTPAFFINGKKFTAYSEQAFRDEFNKLLKK